MAPVVQGVTEQRSILSSGECNFRSKDRFSRAENATSVQKIDSPERRMQTSVQKIDSPKRRMQLPLRRSILPSGECNFRSEDRSPERRMQTSVQKIDSPERRMQLPFKRSILPSGECQLPFKRSTLPSGEYNLHSNVPFRRAEDRRGHIWILTSPTASGFPRFFHAVRRLVTRRKRARNSCSETCPSSPSVRAPRRSTVSSGPIRFL